MSVPETPLRVERLHKSLGPPPRAVQALADVSFTVPAGTITAVVGHNGAGKTTLLRLIAGLARPDRGWIEVHGHRMPSHAALAVANLGCLIERPGFIGGISGWANLELLARRHGLGGTPVARLLVRCGLDREASLRVVSSYSLGMRQRLGLAAALLGDPRLLVLDEPTNGLDPAGIAWVRDLLDEHRTGGGAAVVSSHLLDEVERIADDVVVLAHGHLAQAGTLDEIVAEASTQVRLRVTGPASAAAAVLRDLGLGAETAGADVLVSTRHRDLPQVSPALAAAGIAVIEMQPTISLLEGALRDAQAREP